MDDMAMMDRRIPFLSRDSVYERSSLYINCSLWDIAYGTVV